MDNEVKEAMDMALAVVNMALDYIANEENGDKLINNYAKACGKLYRALLAEGIPETATAGFMTGALGAIGKKG